MAISNREKTEKIMEQIRFFLGNAQDKHGHRVDRYTHETFEKTRKATKELLDIMNGGGAGPFIYGVVAGLVDGHRFLQNEVIVNLLRALGEYGSMDTYMTDARNEFAHQLCGKLRRALRDELFWRDEE